ncbi:MAG TPA: class I SAM-dependent methyltransferase [Rhizomicrobium sp.]|jgi:SAM-dependent methyltransferase
MSAFTHEMARCYRRYRPPFPQSLLDDLVARTGVSRSGRLLDLACGTGRIAVAIAPAFAAVDAVDLEPAMIAEGEAATVERGIGNIAWHTGKAEAFDTATAIYRLITIGDAFHRFGPASLAAMHSWLSPGGAIAALRSFDTLSGAEPWHRPLRDLVTRFSGRDAEILSTPPPADACEATLKAHGFADVATFTFTTPYVWTVEAILGNLASTSFCATHLLGPRAEEFEGAVRQALSTYAPDDLRETLSFSYTFGRR